jgi:hypothetical protein
MQEISRPASRDHLLHRWSYMRIVYRVLQCHVLIENKTKGTNQILF